MDSDLLGLVELFLVFGIVLVLGVAELVSLRRARRRTENMERARAKDVSPGRQGK